MRFLKSGSENVKQVQWSIQNKDAYSIASEPFMIKLKFVYYWTGKQTETVTRTLCKKHRNHANNKWLKNSYFIKTHITRREMIYKFI